jgi:hypothetical protein
MTITYPHQPKVKRQRPALPPIAPTPVLRADAALADAHRFLGVGMAQALMAATFALLLSNTIQHNLSVAWLAGVGILLFALMAGLIWATVQGQPYGSAPYSSGLGHKASGSARYVMFAALIVLVIGILVPVAMFIAWERHIPFPSATALMQLALLLSQLLLSVSMSLRAIHALKYARAQLSNSTGGAGLDGGVN